MNLTNAIDWLLFADDKMQGNNEQKIYIYIKKKKTHSSSAIFKKNILIHTVCAQKVRQFAQKDSLRVKKKDRERQKKNYTQKKNKRMRKNIKKNFIVRIKKTQFDLVSIDLNLSSADTK